MVKVIDLYSGVGGFTLGAARAGFDIALAVDLDNLAVQYHAKNFPNALHVQTDISTLSGKQLRRLANINRSDTFGIVGGPPCQGFSTAGLGEVSDPRNSLFLDFFRIVNEARPDFFVIENVPGLLRDRYSSLLSKALSLVGDHYDVVGPTLISAQSIGAPTIRQRVFFVGFHNRVATPLPTEIELKTAHGVEPVFVREALRGLRSGVHASWQSEPQSWRKLDKFEPTDFLHKIVNDVPRGVGDHDAIKVLRKEGLVSGFFGTVHTKEVIERFAKLKEGQMDPISRCQRLAKNGFCPTLRAGTNRDKGAFQALRPIHPTSARVITPREAARLQGFPDWFQFHPTKWHSFRQIGNSVSPIVSEHIMRSLGERFGVVR